MVAGLFSISPTNRISPRRPPSAIATACFFFATSNATNNSLYSPMVRPPCVRLCSVCTSNPRSLPHEGADHRPHARNMTSSEENGAFRAREGYGSYHLWRTRRNSQLEFLPRPFEAAAHLG